MRARSILKRVDGYVIVIDPQVDRNGKFSVQFWIYDRDTISAAPIVWKDLPADYVDAATAVAVAEELARVQLEKLKR